MEDISKSIKSILYERTKSPFYGAFLLSWLIWNWELLYYFIIYDENFYEKVSCIKENYIGWNYNLLFPFYSAIIFYTLGSLASIGFQWIKIQLSNISKSKVEKFETLSIDESYKLKNDIQEREMEMSRKLVDLNEALKRSEDKNSNLLIEIANKESSISALSKEKDSYQKETFKLRADIEEMQQKYIESNLLDQNVLTFTHKGWQHQDIVDKRYKINKETNFYAKISYLNKDQSFVIYLGILLKNNQRRWIGFSGGNKNSVSKTNTEYTRTQIYNSNEVIIRENILSILNVAFPEIKEDTFIVDKIRLRGDNVFNDDITFSYKIF
ncbi:MAG: hypothetical protein COA31_005490 [Flavobacteriales bacterium]|nr:hypothetical protein [Flavobacteriales bacterium]